MKQNTDKKKYLFYPSESIVTRWSQDKFSYGAYSYLGVESTPQDRIILGQSINNKLFFAGEATSTEYPGTIHGAYLEGYRVAKEVLASGHKNAIVIGAGITGLASAQYLKKFGTEVIILEGRDRIGGRIWTSFDLGVPLEMGAMWIHGDSLNNPLVKTALSSNINLYNPQNIFSLRSKIYDNFGNPFPAKKVLKALKKYVKFIEQLKTKYHKNYNSLKDSLKDYLKINVLTDDELKLLNFLIYINLEMPSAAYLSEQSYRYNPEAFAFSGNNALVAEGLISIINILAKGINIKFNQFVFKIDYQGTNISTLTNKNIFNSTALIITVPLGVLKKNIINFCPSLPFSKLNLLKNLGFGSLKKVFLKYNYHLFPFKTKSNWAVIEKKSDLFFVCSNLYKIFGYPVILLEGTSAFVDYVNQHSDKEIVELTNHLILNT